MLTMFLNAVKLFCAGKLFRDGHAVLRQWLKGFALCLVIMVAVGWAVSPLIGVVAAALVGGFVQPLLFRDLKYA